MYMGKVMKNDYSGLYVPENVRSELNTDKALKSIGIDEKIKMSLTKNSRNK